PEADARVFDRTFGTALDGSLFPDGAPVRLFEIPTGKLPPEGQPQKEDDYIQRLQRYVDHLRERGCLRPGVFGFPFDEPKAKDCRGTLVHALTLTRRAVGDAVPLMLTAHPGPLDPIDDWYPAEEERSSGPELWRVTHARDGETDPRYPGWV